MESNMNNPNILILLVTVFAVGINAYPWGVGFETGVSTKAEVKTNTTAKVEPGFDNGLTVDGKARTEVSGSWLKNIFGKAYVLNSKGDALGVSGSTGSVIDGEAGGEAGAKLKTNVIHTEIDKNGSLDGKASYKAGADVHFIDTSEVEGVEGVNRGIKKHSEETDNVTTQDSKRNTHDSDSKPGIIKRVWNWIG